MCRRAIFLSTIAIVLTAGVSQSHARLVRPFHLAQSTQTFAACMVSCNSQYLSCVSPCTSVVVGTDSLTNTASSTVGKTTSQPQCYLNCTSQQQLCQQGCSGLQ
jgi:hypothetical protein